MQQMLSLPDSSPCMGPPELRKRTGEQRGRFRKNDFSQSQFCVSQYSFLQFSIIWPSFSGGGGTHLLRDRALSLSLFQKRRSSEAVLRNRFPLLFAFLVDVETVLSS